MTLIVSWIAVDTHGPASIYILGDSRVTWTDGSQFDYARKVFGCKNHPDVFGYCGDVLFPSIVLNQIVDTADAGMLFEEGWNCEEKFQAIYAKIKQAFDAYPSQVKFITADSLEIIHASREKDMNFFCKSMKWFKSTGKWSERTVEFDESSKKPFVIGSGKDEFKDRYLHYNAGDTKVSRSVFHCFNESLQKMTDKSCGGAPQLVGLYRKFNSQPFGIIYEKKRYLHGLDVDSMANYNSIQWRNELFEVCDGETMAIKLNATRQPNPRMC